MLKKICRPEFLRALAAGPAIVASVAVASSTADAADTRTQLKYQDTPDKKTGQKCSGCQLFKPPNACVVITGTISPNGWCTAWAKKS